MVTYIGLLKFTDQGIKGIKQTTQRAAAAKEVGQRMGVNMREIYWTLGEYDLVCVLEAADETALNAFNIAVATQGNVRSQSLRALTAAEMDKVLAKLP
ncbi:MAG: GYD domain-containing protein [Aquincola sp.]|nr:GYD domain-containing protein [Aquincola sp.]MDH4289344.1 GYD domain-containing protein [Aquincola sp.]MDH5330377.1 GYD domain-containing protein [Aquincola sp.]